MSNAEQAGLGIVGGVVGFFIGGPVGAYYGAQVGVLAGTVLFPTQLPGIQGPRLGDGQQTVSVVGAPIPWHVGGTQTYGGIIFWASPIREVANTETAGGKGSPEQKQTTYSYFRSFAILLCEPPNAFTRPVAGIRRIWANGKIIYSKSPGAIPVEDLEDTSYQDAVQELVTQAANQEWGAKMTIYLGTEDQMPDPTMESFLGAGNVSGMRGYVYVVFNDVELRVEDGNRIPAAWKFEVYEEGTASEGEYHQYAQEILYDWTISSVDPRNASNDHSYFLGYVSPGGATTGSNPGGSNYDSLEDAQGAILSYKGAWYDVLGFVNPPATEPLSIQGGSLADNDNAYTTLILQRYQPSKVFTVDQALALTCDTQPDIGSVYYTGGRWGHANADVIYNSGETGSCQPLADYDGCFRCASENLTFYYTENADVLVQRLPVAPPVCAQTIPGFASWCISPLGTIVPAVAEWELDESQTFHVLRSYVASETDTQYPLGPVIPAGHPRDTQENWEASYEVAVLRGQIEPGLVYGVDYPVNQSFAYRLSMDLETVEVAPVSLGTLIRRICERVGERAGHFEYDATDLDDVYVIGYQVGRTMAARNALDPLRQIGFFDVVESIIELKFSKRGKAAVATLTDEDLGAHFVGESRPSKITTRKLLEMELPRQIRAHYQHPDRNYDPGEELSPPRFDTKAESVVDVDLAAALEPDHAAQVVEVLYRDAWWSRWSHQTQVDQSWSALEPGDAILVPVDSRLERMRVAALTDRLVNLRALELLRDDDGNYESTAVGTTPEQTPSPINFPSPVVLTVMDLPPLTIAHDSADVYAAVYPLIPGLQFNGVAISRSTDGGGTFSLVASVSEPTPVGTVLTPLGEGVTTTWDDGSSLIVELAYGALENRSAADVIDGANAFAVGRHGRWEIVQFRDATEVATNIYELSGLLRGRRATEHHVGTGQAGDTFVLLDGVARIPLSISEVGAEILYRATPINSPQGTTSVALTGAGEALKPFSPVHIEGERDVDGDLAITWTRRDRLYDESLNQTTIPMSEDFEDYEVDILDADGEIRRTLSTSDTSITYTDEMQLDDFGALQSSVDVAVFQISVQVGRGGPGRATL